MAEEIRMQYVRNDNNAWEIRMDGEKAATISKSLLSDGMPEESVIQTMNNAAEVLGYCPNPASEEPCKKTGIVIGKVQSGKTSNFISLTALAFDNGYKVIVVFGGTKKILVGQNKARIEQYYRELADTEVVILDTNSNKSILNSEKIEQFVEMGRNVIIVALKKPIQIKRIRENVFEGSYLSDYPTLIIDDEGDEASLNTLVKKNKKSSTYLEIEKLKNALARHCFVSVTATPQANILIDAIDVLSPDFGVLVNPGMGYCGLDVFHGSNGYVIPIPENDDLQGKGLPESFKRALAMFFVACAIHRTRTGDPNAKLSMLVHESQFTEVHKNEYEKIMAVINQWRNTSSNKKDIAYKQDLKKLLKDAYSEYETRETRGLTSFQDLEDKIIDAIKGCNAHIVNGLNASNGDDKYYSYNIYIGGSLLGRGLTIKNLAITYITRTPKGKATVDTSEQRARWFGYKRDILDLCRVFMVPKLEGEFLAIRDHEEDLWETVQYAHMQGTRFKDIVRIFTLSNSMRMTRTSVADADTFKFTHWNKQRIFQDVSDYIISNTTIIDSFKDNNKDNAEVQSFGEGAPYTIVHSTFDVVCDELLSRFLFPTEEPKLNDQLIHHLKLALEKHNIHPQMDVIWMRDRDGATSDHDIKEGNRIPNYSVGRRPKDQNRPQVYAGDDKQFCKDGVLQLQIHNIRDNASSIVSPTLALYIPDDIVSQITDLVYRA